MIPEMNCFMVKNFHFEDQEYFAFRLAFEVLLLLVREMIYILQLMVLYVGHTKNDEMIHMQRVLVLLLPWELRHQFMKPKLQITC